MTRGAATDVDDLSYHDIVQSQQGYSLALLRIQSRIDVRGKSHSSELPLYYADVNSKLTRMPSVLKGLSSIC